MMEQVRYDLSCSTWEDITISYDESIKTPIEKMSSSNLSNNQAEFIKNGYIILKGFFKEAIELEAYTNHRQRLPKDRSQLSNYWSGWSIPTPYMLSEPLLSLATMPMLQWKLYELIGFPMGLHLCLTGWVSTERKWHQDTYLNPDFLGSRYIAAWIALDDIHPDSGPFQLVAGSHKWRVLDRERLFHYLTREQQLNPDWPTFTQDHISDLCEQEIKRNGADVVTYTPEKGDLLLWHSNLVHRGSAPKNPELLRRSLICHYSSILHRYDMTKLRRHDNGSLYFDLPAAGRVSPPK